MRREWFDLETDPGEGVSRNDADDEIDDLQRRLDELARDGPMLEEREEQRIEPSADMIEGLRALGYVE